jgi:peptidoglycan-associated lipoprotein
MMNKRIWAGFLTAAMLAGCASGVKLDDVPVEDKSATSSGGASSQGVGAGQSGVSGVLVDKSAPGVGPAGVGTVVYFDYDSYVVRAEARSLIETHARFLKANQQRKASLEGHTDERGGREYNLALGQKRAEAVRQAMTLLGVSDAQIEAVSYGKEKPSAMGSSETDLAKNRRVEIRY